MFDKLAKNKILVAVILIAGLLGLPRTVFGEDLPWLQEHIGPVTDFVLTSTFAVGMLLGLSIGLLLFRRARRERDRVLDELTELSPDYRWAVQSESRGSEYRYWEEPPWLREMRGNRQKRARPFLHRLRDLFDEPYNPYEYD